MTDPDFLQAGRYCHAPRAPLAAHCTEMGPSLGISRARIKVPSSHALSDPGRRGEKICPREPMAGGGVTVAGVGRHASMRRGERPRFRLRGRRIPLERC